MHRAETRVEKKTKDKRRRFRPVNKRNGPSSPVPPASMFSTGVPASRTVAVGQARQLGPFSI